MVKYDLRDRLFDDEPMYCEGLHKPRWRGYLHACMVLVQFRWWYLICCPEVAHSSLGAVLASVYMAGGLFSYGMSTLLHCGTWGPRAENLLLKLDHAGIFLMVAGNFVPIGIMCLPVTGLYMLGFMWVGVMVGIFRIFVLNRTTWWEPIAVGATSLISIKEMYQGMAPHAFWSTMGSYVASVVGAVVFANQWPDPWPDHFGFHEIMHVLTSLASVLVYIANHSVVSSCSYKLSEWTNIYGSELVNSCTCLTFLRRPYSRVLW